MGVIEGKEALIFPRSLLHRLLAQWHPRHKLSNDVCTVHSAEEERLSRLDGHYLRRSSRQYGICLLIWGTISRQFVVQPILQACITCTDRR